LVFLKEIRAAFPPGEAPRLGSDETLRRVERIDPSFSDWAKELADTKPQFCGGSKLGWCNHLI
jgi:hypothetical protein